jgi:transcription elongation factor GreA
MNASEVISSPADAHPTLRRAAAHQSTRVTLTADGAELLRAKLETLKRELDEEYPIRLREARSFGDAAGNDDYLQIKEEEALLVQRIQGLQAMLASATVLPSGNTAAAGVVVGSRVEVENLESGAVSEHLITGGFEGASAGVSADSPVGQALLGRRAGDRVEVGLPGGHRLELRIIGVT